MIVLFSSSLFKTGCIFYPVNKTCFSSETISWSEKDRIKNYSKLLRYGQKVTGFKMTVNMKK
jgi:hypothetical protein